MPYKMEVRSSHIEGGKATIVGDAQTVYQWYLQIQGLRGIEPPKFYTDDHDWGTYKRISKEDFLKAVPGGENVRIGAAEAVQKPKPVVPK